MDKPVHLSIRDDLRIRITRGEWVAGQRLPSETDLAAWYGVARMTIRHAIGALASEGILIRRQGLGTFAADRLAARRTDWLQSYADKMRGQGHDVQTRLIKGLVQVPPAGARQALQLGGCAVAVLVQRLRIVDGTPTVVLTSWLPYTRFAGLDAEPLLDGSLYAMVEKRFGVRIVRAQQTLTAAAAEEAEAQLLDLCPGDPVLRMVRTTYDGSNIAVEHAISVARSGYLVEAILEPSAESRQAPNPDSGTP
jgi:GntR family transcriptional regulator